MGGGAGYRGYCEENETRKTMKVCERECDRVRHEEVLLSTKRERERGKGRTLRKDLIQWSLLFFFFFKRSRQEMKRGTGAYEGDGAGGV